MFSNALFSDQNHPRLCLVEGIFLPESTNIGRELRRGIERLQTMAFLQGVLEETELGSGYALDKKLTAGDTLGDFPSDRPKVADRMKRLGEPAVAKYLASDGHELDEGANPHISWMIKNAPRTSSGLLRMPLWRLLDPQPLTHVEWQKLKWDLLDGLSNEPLPIGSRAAAWSIVVKTDPPGQTFCRSIGYNGRCPELSLLTQHLLIMRQWELAGDLVGYDMALQQALHAAHHVSATKDLSVLQPHIGDFIASCFGTVSVLDVYLEAQSKLLKAGRQAWKHRTLGRHAKREDGFDESR